MQSCISFEHVTVQSWIMFIQWNMHSFGTTECATMHLTQLNMVFGMTDHAPALSIWMAGMHTSLTNVYP